MKLVRFELGLTEREVSAGIRAVYVNPDHVSAVIQQGDDHSRILLASGQAIVVVLPLPRTVQSLQGSGGGA